MPLVVRPCAACGTTASAVVWIEHVVHALVAVVDRLMCLAAGEVLAQGEPHEVIRSPEVVEVYLGSTVGRTSRSGRTDRARRSGLWTRRRT